MAAIRCGHTQEDFSIKSGEEVRLALLRATFRFGMKIFPWKAPQLKKTRKLALCAGEWHSHSVVRASDFPIDYDSECERVRAEEEKEPAAAPPEKII